MLKVPSRTRVNTSQPKIRLGVNIDHIATLREVRKATYPSLLEALFICERAGADQITVHLREDRRHIQDADVSALLQHSHLPLNLEMAWVPEMVKKAAQWQPHSVTLVPERREEMTTESGLDLNIIEKAKRNLGSLQKASKVYGFIEPNSKQVQLAKKLGLDGIEFHTGHFSHLWTAALRDKKKAAALNLEIDKLNQSAKLARQIGLEVKAGHGLTTENVHALMEMPGLEEVNIGHFIVARAVIVGLHLAIVEMKQALNRAV